MKRLDAALSRLNSAIRTLETSLAHRLEMASAAFCSAAPNQSEAFSELRAERDQLSARVVELEEEQRYLSGLTEEVESRLDGAISEIREALSRN